VTLDEFRYQIDRLVETYGKDKYPKTRVHLFWECLRNESPVTLEKAVSRLIAESRTAPMLQDLSLEIREDHARQRQRRAQSETEKPSDFSDQEPVCDTCQDTGAVFAIHKENNARYTFRCPCSAGISREVKWPMWNDCLSVNYDLR
jgi:hypothetical protein